MIGLLFVGKNARGRAKALINIAQYGYCEMLERIAFEGLDTLSFLKMRLVFYADKSHFLQ